MSSQKDHIQEAYKRPPLYQLAGLPWSVPHEWAHYLIGRLLGVDITLHKFHVSYPMTTALWKADIITIAPTILALSVLTGSVLMVGVSQIPSTVRDLIFLYGLLFLLTCIGDWIDIYTRHGTRHGKGGGPGSGRLRR